MAHTNLRIAFGGTLSPKETRQFAQGAFVNMVQTIFEFIMLSRYGREQVAALTEKPEGYDQYQAAVIKGKGVIAVSAHYANWYWPVVCAAIEGYKVHVVVRPLDNPLLDSLMNRAFEHWGIGVIPRNKLLPGAVAALRKGETLALMVDQNAAIHGCFVPFFGVPAATMRGLAALRRGVDAEVVCINDLRIGRRHKVIMSRLQDIPEEECALLRKVNQYFEQIIAENKEQYFWVHPRWKRRPEGESSFYVGLRV